jgi:hypothetical protein
LEATSLGGLEATGLQEINDIEKELKNDPAQYDSF